MTDLTLLHLSDLHWSAGKAKDQTIVIDALIQDLNRLQTDGVRPDLILFTGDLVQAGDNAATFDEVRTAFLDRVRAAVPNAPLFVVPGNHDIQREVVRAGGGYVDVGLKAQLTSVDRLNHFIDGVLSREPATIQALERLGNFEAAYPSFQCPPTIRAGALLKTYAVEVRGKAIGVASFNTAWRATGEADNLDRHHLLLGERHVDVAVEDLADCDYRIALFHHPLDWLADFDSIAVGSRLYAEFDVLAFGHSHRAEPEARITPAGTAILSQAGCLYENRRYFNGYQVISITDDGRVEFLLRSYFDRRRAFDRAVEIAPDGMVVLPYAGRTRLPNAHVDAFLRETRPVIRAAAAEQVNIVEAVSNLRLDAKEAFICPPLRVRRASDQDATGEGETAHISAEDLLRSEENYLVVGPRESGKSTLAHYLAVLSAEGAIDRPRIPAVIDFRKLKANSYGLGRAIATYYGAAKQGLDVEERLRAGDFLLILDNFSGRDRKARDELTALIERYSGCRWLLLADSVLGAAEVQEADKLKGFRIVHIQALPRKSIRELSRRWCEPAGLDNQKAFTAVMEQLRAGSLPRTGYMVTLLLWGLYQERQFERINEALLLTYVVDHLLGKADFKQVQLNFDPTSKEITLQHLASVLREAAGVLPKNDVLQVLIDFFKRKGLQYDASDVLAKLISCGLLTEADGLISFKYRCFEEYFYANLLRSDNGKLGEALRDRRFVEYARELELLAGLRRQNKDLLDVISAEITAGMPSELNQFTPALFDEMAAEETGAGLTSRRLEDIRKKKLSADQIDDLMDAADRAAARERGESKAARSNTSPEAVREPDEIVESSDQMPATPMAPVTFMASVDLLGRVLRNSEFTDAADKNAAARLHLRSSVQVMMLYADIIKELLEELSSEKGGQILTEEEGDAVRYSMLKWFVLGTSVEVSEQVGTEKLFSIYDEMLDDPTLSTAEYLLIAMVMLDVNHPRWPAAWEHLTQRSKDSRFILDLLMDRLWRLIHTRPLPDAERTRVEAAAERIEVAFGLPKEARSEMRKTIRDSAKETARKEAQEVER